MSETKDTQKKSLTEAYVKVINIPAAIGSVLIHPAHAGSRVIAITREIG